MNESTEAFEFHGGSAGPAGRASQPRRPRSSAGRTLAWLVLFALMATVGVRVYAIFRTRGGDTLPREQAAYQRLRTIIRQNYVDELKDEQCQKLFYGAMEGMVSKLDKHTRFLPPDANEQFTTKTTGHFAGIGIELSADPKKLTVLTPLQDTPAYRGGVLPGDRILKIDGFSTEGLDQEACSKLIKGEPGVPVKLVLLHEGSDKPVEITLVRDVIQMKSVQDAQILGSEWVPVGGPKIGYAQITQFQPKTDGDLDTALKSLEQKGMQGLILDLRQNPGGLLESAEKIADFFLKDGLIVSVITRSGPNGEAHIKSRYATGTTTHPQVPIVVLVDSRSASASEIVAGCLRGRGRALLVGDKTYGKFSVQDVIPVPLEEWGEAALKLTIAHYKTPNGECIDGQGIVPDYLVPSTPEQMDALGLDRFKRHLRANNPRGIDGEIKIPPLPGEDSAKPAKPFVDEQLKKAVEVMLTKSLVNGTAK